VADDDAVPRRARRRAAHADGSRDDGGGVTAGKDGV
jgi:hypothetical protein